MAPHADWIREAKEGSSEAFTRIVREYQSRVRAFLWAYLRDRDAVEDLAQETFLHAYRGLSTYRGESTVGVWLIGIARHLAGTYFRERTARSARETEVASFALARWLGEKITEASEETERKIAALEACLEKLPEHSARLVRAFYFEGERGADMGRRVGKSESAVWVTLLRIRQALRRCIEARVHA